VQGLTVAMVGDVLHSRVARSNIYAHQKLGNKVILVGPPTLVPDTLRAFPVEIEHDFDRVLPRVDVLIMLRIQQERMKSQLFPSVREYHRLFGLDAHRMARLRKDVLVLHPGPMNRDVEITTEAADSERAGITLQVAHGVFARMAVLLLTLGDGGDARH
jgi:aspartate carbamoyltransferase catalytic subunit